MKKIYHEASRKSGIYKITNKLNGRFYIGSSKRFKQRFLEHERRLKKKNHYNQRLQNDFNKCLLEQNGNDDFMVFEVIEVIEGDKQLRLDAEQKFLNQYWDNCDKCYNISKSAVCSDKETFAQPLKGKTWEEIYGVEKAKELKELLSLRTKGKPSLRKGKKQSKEAIEKSVQANRGHHRSLKTEIQKGQHLSPRTEFKKGRTGKKGKEHPSAKSLKNIKLLSPTGELFTEIVCIMEFLKEHDIGTGIYRVLNGKRKSHKGWKLLTDINNSNS